MSRAVNAFGLLRRIKSISLSSLASIDKRKLELEFNKKKLGSARFAYGPIYDNSIPKLFILLLRTKNNIS